MQHSAYIKAPLYGLALSLLVSAFTACGGSEGKTGSLDSWKDSAKGSTVTGEELSVQAGDTLLAPGDYTNFTLSGQAYTEPGATSALLFHTQAGKGGYEVLFHNGAIDGSTKTGSLSHVRNLYRSLATDTAWFDFEMAVRGKNIAVSINGVDVVCYTEPAQPYRSSDHADQLLSKGVFALVGKTGKTAFKNLHVTALPADATNPNDTLPAIDEQNDAIIRLQQKDFPVIDWHVHLKGGLTKEQAHGLSMNYGINYGVAPNAGEGGVGRMLANDQEVYDYHNEVKNHPFLFGVQGEGRRWITQFSPEALGIFDYLFTDGMTIVDKGRISRIYRAEEVYYDGRSKEQYMDVIVDQTVKILTNEPADIYANPTYIPEDMQADYDKYWTDERINKVLDVMEQHHIALEINPRYKIPSFKIIQMAKDRGLKFTFGTNNVDANFGKLEYAIEAIEACGLTPADLWFPTMSVRRERQAVDYNHFGKQ